MFFAHSDWLLNLRMSIHAVLFPDSPPVPPSERRQTRAHEQNGLPRFAAVANKVISQIIKQFKLMPKYTKVTKFGLQVTCVVGPRKNGHARGRRKPVKKFFVYKYKLSLALLYLADMFINKLNGRESRLNSFFFNRIVLNTKRIL